ncbi:hypothetical protein [Agrococcus sp. GCM10030264]|uniref:hypothetical protein n=1 Tax=Agrococcus sp. GCM10030264 TaxID=3273377 RepID=UPI00361F7BB5
MRGDERVEQALRAVVMRREGYSYADIASRLGISTIEAQEVARVAYAQLGEQTADELRVEVEDRLDEVIRKATRDLMLATSQTERTALYRVLLTAEAQRARLLGLNLKGEGHGQET